MSIRGIEPESYTSVYEDKPQPFRRYAVLSDALCGRELPSAAIFSSWFNHGLVVRAKGS
jgi:hypothetical protein